MKTTITTSELNNQRTLTFSMVTRRTDVQEFSILKTIWTNIENGVSIQEQLEEQNNLIDSGSDYNQPLWFTLNQLVTLL